MAMMEHWSSRSDARKARLQPVEQDDDGQPLLWFDVVFSIAGHDGIHLPFQGIDADHARDAFLVWLEEGDWQTIDSVLNGAKRKLTFRTSWVAGFTINAAGGKVRRG